MNCPDNLVADCSGECLTPRAECAAGCTIGISQPVPALGDLPMRIRLPAPSNSPDCCAPVSHMVALRHTKNVNVRFSVSPPWRLVGPDDTEFTNNQLCMHNSFQCIVRHPVENVVYAFTDDPNAPPTDVLLEAANSCP